MNGAGGSNDNFRPPRPIFLLALAGAVLAWWLTDDPVPPAPREVAAAPPPPPAVVDTLDSGETLSDVWTAHGLSAGELPAVVEAGEKLHSWRTLRPGSVYRITLDRDERLRRFDVEIDRDHRLVIRRTGGGFAGRLVETPFVRKVRRIATCIEDSPWRALERAGEDPALTILMAEVLAAQVDFYTDLRPEDCFETLFRVDERPDGTYRIAALDAIRFVQRSRTLEAYRFSPEGGEGEVGWYDEEGRSLERRFLRSPLKYARISSGFGMRRHPILRRVRPHYGIDYAAPVGTPVQAAGNGVVVAAGRNGGYGLYVKLKHGKRYATSYAHLSRIANGVRRGTRVEQGRVIGYVGSTGLSTGPHLDYRFQENGKYVNPLSIDLPPAIPLEGAALEAFFAHRDRVRHRLHVDGDFAASGDVSRTDG